jgi:CheY-like chemotaxis protein
MLSRQRYMEAYLGEVERAKDRLSPGARFHYTMIRANEIMAAMKVIQEEKAALSARRRLVKVLIIEDNKELAEAMFAAMDDKGHEIYVENTAEDGIDAAKQDPKIDFILLDFGLPKMGGLAAAIRLRELLPKAPIWIITGHPVESIPECEAITGIFQKPLDLNRLYSAMGSN